MKSLICERARMIAGGGPTCPVYKRKFSVEGLNNQKVGLQYTIPLLGKMSTVSVKKFIDLIPEHSRIPLDTDEQVMRFLEKEIEHCRGILDGGYDRQRVVSAKYSLDAFETGRKLLKGYMN